MIRASNFPVLLAIAVYERQQYNDTSILESIGDFAEKYLGSLPRKLMGAGQLPSAFVLDLQLTSSRPRQLWLAT
jgi:hypothetical protein